MIDSQPLLVLRISSDFKALGIALVISESGTSRNTYMIKKNISEPKVSYCNPRTFKNMYSKKINGSITTNKIVAHITMGLNFFIINPPKN